MKSNTEQNSKLLTLGLPLLFLVGSLVLNIVLPQHYLWNAILGISILLALVQLKKENSNL